MHHLEIDFVLALFILGAAFLALLYHAVLLFFSKDKFLVHYLVYLFCVSIFLFAKTGLYGHFYGEVQQNYLWMTFREAIQMVYLTSYFNFIIHAVGISQQPKPFLFRHWPKVMIMLMVYTIWFSLSKVYGWIDNYTIPFVAVRTFIFGITGVMLYQSYKLRQIKFQLIILYGCTLYFIFGMMSFITNLLPFEKMFIYPLEWLMIGSFVDIVFFSVAIGYRNKKQWEALNLTLLEEANKLLGLQQEVLAKQSELENERSRIAADMHDDLGSGLTKITYLSQMAMTDTDKNTQLLKIKSTAAELVKNMSELIWVMKEENNTLEDLATYIKSYAVEYLENNNIGLQICIPEFAGEITIDGHKRRNLFLSVKESLHNIVKHAKADEVHIEMTIGSDLTLKIKDNGIGIAQPEAGKSHRGNGIRNMKDRIERMDGAFYITSGSGTEICFNIPISGMS